MKFPRDIWIVAAIATMALSSGAGAENGSVAALSAADAKPSKPGYEVPPYIDGKLAYHHHPLLRFVFYNPESSAGGIPDITRMLTPPKDVGIEWVKGKQKYREIHTHEAFSGRLHTESTNPTKKYRLGDFIELWAQGWGELKPLVERAETEGTVYLFDYDAFRGEYRSTRLEDAATFQTLFLDDGRHIVVFVPDEKKAEQ